MSNMNSKTKVVLEQWVVDILANPVTKCPATQQEFKFVGGVMDARVLLKNTFGFSEWLTGQVEYEKMVRGGQGESSIEAHKEGIGYVRPVYEHFNLDGVVLDVGGGACTVREFLPAEAKVVSVDPYISCIHEIQPAQIEAYSCLARPLNFIGAAAEFLPFIHSQFDWVHMRSMLDHVQVPDLALLEANRVLKNDGNLLIGLYVEGGKSGRVTVEQKVKHLIKDGLTYVGIDKWQDHHTWHPTFSNLIKLIEDNGFIVNDVYWQPHYVDQVCYVHAKKHI